MIALLRNIRNLKCRIEELKETKRGVKDLERCKRIDEQISLLESLMKEHKELTIDFVNQLPTDLRKAVFSYYYEGADKWSNVEIVLGGKMSKDYCRITIERQCDEWDTK